MVTGWITSNDKSYYLNSEGTMQPTGWIKDETGKWYYLYSDGTYKIGWMNDDGENYYLYSNGQMAVNWTQMGDERVMNGTISMSIVVK